jgi:hypothetical protein
MKLELLESGYVRFTGQNNIVTYRPTTSYIVTDRRRGLISIVAFGTAINNVIELKPNELEGDKCIPQINTTSLDKMEEGLLEYFNPNIGLSNTPIVDALNAIITQNDSIIGQNKDIIELLGKIDSNTAP